MAVSLSFFCPLLFSVSIHSILQCMGLASGIAEHACPKAKKAKEAGSVLLWVVHSPLPPFFSLFISRRRRSHFLLSLSLSLSLSLCSTPLLPLYKTTTNQPNSAATDVEIEDSPPPVEYFETFGSLEKKVAR